MKKVVLSMLLSFGVGLSLMASPAQVSDDNNAQVVNHSSVTAVTVQPQNHAQKTDGRIKYELPRKAINPSKLSAPKLMSPSELTTQEQANKPRNWDSNDPFHRPKVCGIISDPTPPKPKDPGHQNDPYTDPRPKR